MNIIATVSDGCNKTYLAQVTLDEINIDSGGVITNWPKYPNVAAFFPRDEEELREITDDNVVGQHRVFVARGGGA